VEPQYDVFLSYNSKDRPSVEQVANKLISCGISVWLDESEIVPGTSPLQSIDQAIRRSRSVAVFVSNESLGPWQNREVQASIQSQIVNNIRVIPVLLPGASLDKFNALPLFLTNNRYVDFRTGLDEPEEFYNLRWGILEEKPPLEQPDKPEAAVVEPTTEINAADEALNDLVEILKAGTVTFFLGPGASYGSNPMPAQASDIARDLLAELKIIQADYQELLPPVDVAGLYFGVRSGDRLLETRVTGRMADRSKVFPQTHDLLAGLLKLLAKRPPRRSSGGLLQLIVTTNLDLMAERALLRGGVSFTRIVQFRTGQNLDVTEYKQVQLIEPGKVQLPDESGNLHQASVTDFDELDWLIANCGSKPRAERRSEDETPAFRFNKLTEPILYKFLGSQDVPNSCVISTSHHFEFARGVLQNKGLPDELTSTIRNTTILFLGLWFMDPDFRLTYYTLLHDALHLPNDRRYALQLPPQRFAEDVYRKMERGIWDKIKEQAVRQMSITAIEEPCDTFLRKLHERLRTALRIDP